MRRHTKSEVRKMTAANDEKVPLPSVGFTFNLKRSKSEREAEFDSIDTIKAIEKVLTESGYDVTLLEVSEELPQKLLSKHFDIIFNIAEGENGRSREAQVPALLDFLNLKFTGSDATTLCICLDKALTKHVVLSHNIKTPAFQVVYDREFKLENKLHFPLIVKPNAEGSSKGISSLSIVKNKRELRRLVTTLFETYTQPLLIEEFIEGREFTVGILGNGDDVTVMRPMEIEFLQKKGHNIYDYSVKQDFIGKIEYTCPPKMKPENERLMMETAKKIYNVLGCRDLARVDFRLSTTKGLQFIEINPLPGLAPGYSDMPMIAEKNGIPYAELINTVIKIATERYLGDAV